MEAMAEQCAVAKGTPDYSVILEWSQEGGKGPLEEGFGVKGFKKVAGVSVFVSSVLLLGGCFGGAGAPASPPVGQGGAAPSGTTPPGQNGPSQGQGSNTAPPAGQSPPGGQASPTGPDNPAPAPSQPSQGASFPPIVRMAMAEFPGSILQTAFAPTVVPTPRDGSNALFYETSENTHPIMGVQGFISNYNVQINSRTKKLGTFFGARYDTAAHANGAILTELGNQPLQGTHSTLDLGHGITADLTAATSSATIEWKEGRWQIRVTRQDAAVVPVATAQTVVAYLEKHFMPVPKEFGAIRVTLQGDRPDTLVVWQEGDRVHQVGTTVDANNPVETALAMAISMRPYAGQ
ncbi:hypothetical protein Btus_0388 [Kyrpidia tusciae DSM 2912]|uniref:Uncharacterized protein n=1 Tax=Kyrpidia tusciae (strain DSM 2912 / NBRC 15312 / T2) TaxID=562970 RepID=D5WT54_KYRT2|nr:hypothetical protein Btus_0388 [Kyrpidia tusciae DSM 2912]